MWVHPSKLECTCTVANNFGMHSRMYCGNFSKMGAISWHISYLCIPRYMILHAHVSKLTQWLAYPPTSHIWGSGGCSPIPLCLHTCTSENMWHLRDAHACHKLMQGLLPYICVVYRYSNYVQCSYRQKCISFAANQFLIMLQLIVYSYSLHYLNFQYAKIFNWLIRNH